MKLNILTKKPYSIVTTFKNLLHPLRGPQAVLDSLCKGLDELNIDYTLNPKTVSDTVVVLQNTNALQMAIDLKKQGKIKQLLAGPNIVITPKDANGILENPVNRQNYSTVPMGKRFLYITIPYTAK